MKYRITLAMAVVAIGGLAYAGPFFRCRGGSCGTPATSYVLPTIAETPARSPVRPATQETPDHIPTGTVALQESPTEAIHVPQPWLEPVRTGQQFLPVQDTVLEPVPGTGSKLPIGGGSKIPDLLKQLDALKKQIEGATGGGSALKPTVDINLPLPDGTSQQLSRVLTLVEGLLWLLATLGGSSLAGKLLPLVARVASGLQSSAMAQSNGSQKTAGATSVTPINSSSGGSPVAG